MPPRSASTALARGFVCAAAAIVATALAGCSAPIEAEEVTAGQAGSTEGLVLVEREASAEATQIGVSAKFMRLAANVDPESAERLVGTRLDLPATGACALVRDDDALPRLPRSSHAAVELLDVGELALQVDKTEPLWLVTRAFPDVGELVSGVFYTTREDAADLGAGTLVVSASGSSQVDHFEISAESPSDLDEVRVDDELLADGLPLPVGRAVTVTWDAEHASVEDRVFVDVTNPAGATTRCAFADAGRATLRGELFDVQALGALPATATIEVHRIRRTFFGASAIDQPSGLDRSPLDAGEVRFDLSVLGRVTVDRTPE